MPNYPKPLWIVLDPKGRPFLQALRSSDERAKMWISVYEDRTWEKLFSQGYRCVRVKRLEW